MNKNKQNNFNQIPFSKDVLTDSHMGIWAIEIDPDVPARLYGDENMMKLLGITDDVTPEEALEILDNNIDKDHYAEVHAAIDKMTEGYSAEVQYPWHNKDGSTVIIRCGGKRNKAYKKGVRLEGIHRDITDLIHYDREKELLEQIRESEKVTDTFIKTYTLVFKVNLDDDNFTIIKRDNVLIRNPTAVKKFSKALESFINTVVYEKDKEVMKKKIDYGYIKKRLKTAQSFSLDYRVMNGETTEWHEMNIRKLDENQVAVGIANRNQEILFEHLQDKMNDDFFAIFSIDLDTGLIKIIKKADWYNFCELGQEFSYSDMMKFFAKNLEGESKEFFLLHSNIEYTKKILATEDKRSLSYQSTILNTNPWVTVTEYVIYRHEDGTPATFILAFSLLDSLGADKQELQNQLKKAVDMAQSANRAKTTFLNNMSHDIRTPMNAIIGYTELANRHIDNKEEVKDYLGKISHSSDHLLSLINDVLDMSRIESGKMNIEEKDENLFEILQTISDIIQADIQAKKLKFTILNDSVKNANIICDKLRLKQVLLNILSNSVKYTQENGSISLEVLEQKSSKDKFGKFQFKIKDNGMGMPKEFLNKIFEPFTRLNSSTVSGIQGTGLGMPITKNLIERMGGTISIESEPGTGTCVTVNLDFKLQNSKKTNNIKTEVKEDFIKLNEIDFKGKKILLVEDNELNREIATLFLEESGFVIETAEDGTIAVEKMKQASAGDFDLILMDIQMPCMNGYEATRQIRALESDVNTIPIIAMTANAFDEDRKKAFEVGMNDYIAKPINLEDLKNVLAKVLK